MSPPAGVIIHPSQFPQAVRLDLLDSLRSRRVNHKFLYDSHRQTQKWLALHQAFAPSRTDPDCAAIYDASFAAVAAEIDSRTIHVVGLGCGGGQKDTRLLRLLKERSVHPGYTPSDVSTAMVLVAREAALDVIAPEDCHPFVCDLATADDLPGLLGLLGDSDAPRLLTFFGMIPNFEPGLILPRLASLVRPGDHLLFSANLAPGPDYDGGLRRILPLYDNDLTRDWLMAFLVDLGIETADGELRFGIEAGPGDSGLKRVAAHFHFLRSREIQLEGETFRFSPGDDIRLFFSYRHTADKVRSLLAPHGIEVREQWITKSEEEGVFWCQPGR
jgi:uncharacterized SAM-dependent methyltransferase